MKFLAPLSGNQEVSGFGEGDGDTGDNWKLLCESQNNGLWNRDAIVTFQHVDTGKYLYTSTTARFNHQNCGSNCPILDQTEVSSSLKNDVKNRWTTGQGLYISAKDFKDKRDEYDDDL